MAFTTCEMLGFTRVTSSITSVGTVSFPPAACRTNAAPRGSFRMLTSLLRETPAKASSRRRDEQNGHP